MKRDIKLDHAEAGEGSPPLVFVHGFASGREDWQPQFANFAKAHRVVIPDLRGHGATARGAEVLSIETLAADVEALLVDLDISGAVLAGHSMGCRIVLETRRRAPDRIAAVVLVDGSNIGIGDKDGAQRRLDEGIATNGYESFMLKLFGNTFFEGHDPDLKERILTRVLALPAEIGHPLIRNLIAYDADKAVAAMRECDVPVLVLQSTTFGVDLVRKSLNKGETSPYIDLVLANCPRAECAVIPGVGHYVQLEAPAAVNAGIKEFLSTLIT